MLNIAILLTSLWTGVEVAKWIPTEWVEDLFGMFNAERYAPAGKFVIGLIGFLIGFAIGKYVLYFILIFVLLLMLKKK